MCYGIRGAITFSPGYRILSNSFFYLILFAPLLYILLP